MKIRLGGVGVVVLMASLMAGGCTPHMALTTEEALRPGTGDPLQVPQGARIIAYGKYPLSPFVVPHDGGMLYVFDTNDNKVAFVTSYPADSVTPTSGDLSQLSRTSFAPDHIYRVYYLSPHAAAAEPAPAPALTPAPTMPATQPSNNLK